jgi:hypothetical protein
VVSSRYRPCVPNRLATTQEVIADARAGARAHDGEFAQCKRVIHTGRNDLRFEQRGNPIETPSNLRRLAGKFGMTNPFYRMLRLPRKQLQVIGVDLNRSESAGE